MAATKGNQWWKLRSKHGRDKIIQDHNKLRESAEEYFQNCVDNPIIKDNVFAFQGLIYHGEEKLPRVFTKEGLSLYCGVSEWRIITDLKKDSEDFSQVINAIEQIIYTQKIEGAAAGVFNANIIARDLGLADKKEQHNTGTATVTVQQNFKSKKEKDDFENS